MVMVASSSFTFTANPSVGEVMVILGAVSSAPGSTSVSESIPSSQATKRKVANKKVIMFLKCFIVVRF